MDEADKEGGETLDTKKDLQVCPTGQGITFFGDFPVAILENGGTLKLQSPEDKDYHCALSVVITKTEKGFNLKGVKRLKYGLEKFDFDFNPVEDDENFKSALDAEVAEMGKTRESVKNIFAQIRTKYPIFAQMQRNGTYIYVAHGFEIQQESPEQKAEKKLKGKK